jgi:hypothetical protein
MAVERRRHPRFDIAAQVRVKYGRVNYVMDVSNISLSGAFIRCDNLSQLPWFRVDQEVDLDLFDYEDLENISLEGRIVRIIEGGDTEHPGFGVQFLNLTVEAYNKLYEIIATAARLSAQPPPLPFNGGDRGEGP